MLGRALFALAVIAFAAGSARAETSAADFYRNKSVDVYVGFSSGGVYDLTARLLARLMGRHIPGNPSLVPRNMAGAAGQRLANWLYQVAPKDGTAIGTFGRGIAFNQLLGQPVGPMVATKLNWLGSTNDEVSICASRVESGITKFEQLYNQELIVGSTGAGGDDEEFPKIIDGVLGAKLRTVSGFPGGTEIKLAMERGEVGGRCGWSWSSIKATEKEWLETKKIAMLVQLSLHRHPDLPEIPTLMDFARTDQDRQIFKVMLARQIMAWPFAAPPGVPAERVAVLRKAFDETVHDPEFLSEAKRMNLEVMPVSGERIQTMLEELYRTTSPELTAKIAAMLK
jgi:tripartite-type tricarboxylate transporter receptor subunit TctC